MIRTLPGVTVLAACLVCVGCASDPRPIYIEPDLPDGQAAILHKNDGLLSSTFVEEINGSRVKYRWGRAKAAPGTHEVLIVDRRERSVGLGIGVGGGNVGGGVGVGSGTGTNALRTKITLEAGGDYLIFGPDAGGAPRFRILNRATKTEATLP